jgi:hypothetical protein
MVVIVEFYGPARVFEVMQLSKRLLCQRTLSHEMVEIVDGSILDDWTVMSPQVALVLGVNMFTNRDVPKANLFVNIVLTKHQHHLKKGLLSEDEIMVHIDYFDVMSVRTNEIVIQKKLSIHRLLEFMLAEWANHTDFDYDTNEVLLLLRDELQIQVQQRRIDRTNGRFRMVDECRRPIRAITPIIDAHQRWIKINNEYINMKVAALLKTHHNVPELIKMIVNNNECYRWKQ